MIKTTHNTSNANALRQQGEGKRKSSNTQTNSNNLLGIIKGKFLSGQSVRLIDYPENQRSLLISIIAELRDELPIKAGWQTIRESHISETRLRSRSYLIPSEFLRGEIDD